MTTTETKELQVTLTGEEHELRSRTLARLINERALLEYEAKEAASGYSSRLKEAEKEILKTAKAVDTGKEMRLVPVSDKADLRRFQYDTIRHDTLEVISSRAMTKDEIAQATQPPLFDERATADSRDDRAPLDPQEPAPAPVAAAAPEAGCTCGSATPGVHEDNCAAVAAPAGEIRNPAGVLAGTAASEPPAAAPPSFRDRPDGTA